MNASAFCDLWARDVLEVLKIENFQNITRSHKMYDHFILYKITVLNHFVSIATSVLHSKNSIAFSNLFMYLSLTNQGPVA